MADVKISELPAAVSVDSPDLVPIVQAGATKKATISLLQSFLKFVGLDFTGNNLTFMNGTTMWKSTGDNTHAYTPTNSGIIVKDADNNEVWRLWGDGDSNLFLGNALALSVDNDNAALNNTAVGAFALQQLVGGTNNVAIGKSSNDTVVDGSFNTVVGSGAATASDNSHSTEIGFSSSAGDQSIAVGSRALSVGTNTIVIGYNLSNAVDNTAVYGNSSNTDAYFGSTSGNAILHGKGDAIVFPDSDPRIVGAGYWLAGVLTRSNG